MKKGAVRPESPPPGAAMSAALARGRSRLLLRDVLFGIAAGTPVAGVGLVVASASVRGAAILCGLAVLLAMVVIRLRRHTRTAASVAWRIEQSDPSFKNLIVTAEELLRRPGRSPEWIGDRVLREAASRLQQADIRSSTPVASPALIALGALAAAAVLPIAIRSQQQDRPGVPGQAAVDPFRRPTVVDVRLQPPAYTNRPATSFVNPERLEALEGTRLTVSTRSSDLRIRFGDRPLAMTSAGGQRTAELQLSESGYLAIESEGSVSADPVRFVPVTVIADRAPIVRVERPGRDLLLPNARATVDIDAAADDDIGLGSLALKYTKVSGSGEEFEFVEGELPLSVTRQSTQSWRARGRIPVAALGLAPGDSLVYRLTARDGRPNLAGSSSSDTFFVEIAGPGLVPLEGFEMPPEQDRYALSQQMIVVKVRRLREREKALSPTALDEETGAIAAEQRAVRGNFVFLMGGHVEDEEEEAEQSSEIQEGRLENTARREISRAVSHMTTAEQALTAHDTSAALGAALKAVESLQRAFTRNRYILRTMPSRLRIDPSRRLSGSLSDVKDAERPVADPATAPDALLARQLLADVIALMSRLRSDSSSAQAAAALSSAAERALAARPGDARWASIAQSLLRLRGAVLEKQEQARIDADARAVLEALLHRVREDAATVRERTPDRLESAWAGEARR